MLLPTNEKQFGFWKMRRNGSSNIMIANRVWNQDFKKPLTRQKWQMNCLRK